MGLKLTTPAFYRADYAQENLWDKVVYLFTSDKSVSEKIGNMLYHMGKMDDDEVKALESCRIDYKMQTYSNTQKLMAFSGQAVDFVVSKVRRYEGKSYTLLENERDEIRNEIDGAVSSFDASHDRSEIRELMKNEDGVEDKTYAVLGFTHSNLMNLAKEFKDHQSGKLDRMKKMKFISQCVAVTPENFQMKVVHQASAAFANLLGEAMDAYKYVDKFLFYTYRELQRQKIIVN